MEVTYYLDSDLNICPVKKYLECFLPNKFDNPKITNRKNRILATIDQKIQFVKENPGRQASFLSTLHNHNFIEIKSGKDKNTVIRILYAIYNNKIVLLNAFDKSNKYDTNKEKKEVEKYYLITDEYIENLKRNPSCYENYK